MNRFLLALAFLPVTSSITAQQEHTAAATITCNDENAACTHQFIDGYKYAVLTTEKALVKVALANDGKYNRVDVTATNAGASPFDVLPEDVQLRVVEPKERRLAAVTPEKIMSAEKNLTGWANALNALGAGLATQQVTTQASSNGSVSTPGSNGATYKSATYSGSTTSTTSTPDYAAQARAREDIARRNAAIEAKESNLKASVLRANTVMPDDSVHGYLYFESEKRGQTYELEMLVGKTMLRFPLTQVKK